MTPEAKEKEGELSISGRHSEKRRGRVKIRAMLERGYVEYIDSDGNVKRKPVSELDEELNRRDLPRKPNHAPVLLVLERKFGNGFGFEWRPGQTTKTCVHQFVAYKGYPRFRDPENKAAPSLLQLLELPVEVFAPRDSCKKKPSRPNRRQRWAAGRNAARSEMCL